jgi:hypothetical protein
MVQGGVMVEEEGISAIKVVEAEVTILILLRFALIVARMAIQLISVTRSMDILLIGDIPEAIMEVILL